MQDFSHQQYFRVCMEDFWAVTSSPNGCWVLWGGINYSIIGGLILEDVQLKYTDYECILKIFGNNVFTFFQDSYYYLQMIFFRILSIIQEFMAIKTLLICVCFEKLGAFKLYVRKIPGKRCPWKTVVLKSYPFCSCPYRVSVKNVPFRFSSSGFKDNLWWMELPKKLKPNFNVQKKIKTIDEGNREEQRALNVLCKQWKSLYLTTLLRIL